MFKLPPKVFISYSHDSDEHAHHVLKLADALRRDGIDAIIDQYDPVPSAGWPQWMQKNMDDANFVLMVYTETYSQRIMGREIPTIGRGVQWEGNLIRNHIYHNGSPGDKYLPILLDGADIANIPPVVFGHTYYQLDKFDITDRQYEALYRHLTGHPATPAPDLGSLVRLSPLPKLESIHLEKESEAIKHLSPNALDAATLRESIEHLPNIVLHSIGYTDYEISALRALFTERTLPYYSCFISYSHKDEAFAQRLHSRLVQANIRVWYAPEDMKSGQKLHEQIDDAISVHDRLLLILSEESMRSEWVMTEIRKARKEEIKSGKRKLFPINVTVWDNVKEWKCFDSDNGKDLGVEIREYYIPDFSSWKDDHAFEATFQKLLKSLQLEDNAS